MKTKHQSLRLANCLQSLASHVKKWSSLPTETLRQITHRVGMEVYKNLTLIWMEIIIVLNLT